MIGILASSVLLVLCLPLGEQGYLAPVALVPLLAVTRNRGFVWGFLAATICLFITALIAIQGWLYGHKTATSDGAAMAFAACGIFGFSVALTTAVAADTKLGDKPIWALAGWATLFEAALLIELPGHLALSQYRNSGMLAVASVGGIWLVSYLLWLMNLFLSRLTSWRDAWIAVLFVVLVFGAGLVPGYRSYRGTLVAAVQIDPMADEPILAAHREAESKGAVLAVWPEYAGNLFIGRDTKRLKDLSHKTAIVTSFDDNKVPKPHNVAALFADGVESARYAKRKLFGGEKKDHTPGNSAVSVTLGEKRIGLGICFDSCFPSAMRQSARDVDLIALPTIDPASPNGFLAAVHAAYTPFRAAETGVPIIRADGTAYSMIVDSTGRILAEAGLEQKLVTARVPPRFRYPIALYVGDGMIPVAAVLVGLGFWRRRTVA